MKELEIRVVRLRFWARAKIVFRVTQSHLAEGVNAIKPGMYGFYGLHRGSPMSLRNYGKIDDAVGRPMGRVRNPAQYRRLCTLRRNLGNE